MEEQVSSPPATRPEEEEEAGSKREQQAAEQSRSPAWSIPAELAEEQEAQGESTLEPNLDMDMTAWADVQGQALKTMSYGCLDTSYAGRAKFLASLLGLLGKVLRCINTEWDKLGKLIG